MMLYDKDYGMLDSKVLKIAKINKCNEYENAEPDE